MEKANLLEEEGLIWGFKVVFQCLLASAAPALQNWVVFHWLPPNFRESKEKNPTLTLEAFPTFAFAPGTHGCGGCFPAFPRHNETPRPCSASLTGRFPAPRFPWENQPQCWDAPGASLGPWGGGVRSPPAGQPVPTAPAADLIAGIWGSKRDVGGVGGNCLSSRGTPPHLRTLRGTDGVPRATPLP